MLRPYQRALVGGVHAAVREGADAVLMQSPTGSGKTSCVAEGVILPSLAQGRRFVFAAHLEELLDDTAARLRGMGIPCGVVKAGRPADPSAPVQVCSTQTLAPMLARGEAVPPAHRFILDEAHRSSSSTNRAVIAHYKAQGAKILGLSATPCRGDEQPLDEFQALVMGPSVRELITDGFLVEPIVHAPAKVLSRGVAEDPAEVVNVRCCGRRVVVFAPTAADALAIAARIPGAETVLDSTPKAIRSTVRDRLATGETQHLVTVRALCLDAETEILTSDGWAGIDSMTSAHRVANWEGGRVTFEPPAEVIRRERAPGERMVSMDGRRFNLRVTEGHGLLYRTLQGGRFHKKPARELVGKKIELPVAGRAEAERMEPSDGPRPAASRARIISANAYHLRKLEGYDHAASLVEAARRADHRASLRRKRPDELTTDECSLIGFWLGDGWRADLASGGVSYCAVQSFANQPIIDWFDGVVARTGLFCVTSTLPPATKTLHPAKQWRFSRGTGGGSQERKGVYALEPYLAKDGSPLFWGLNDDQFAALIHGFWMADGNHLDGVRIPNRGFDFHNTNKSLLDLLQAIGSVRGYTANLRLSRPSTPKYSPLYSLHLAKRDHVYMGATSRLRFEPDWKAERVWCVRTRAGNIVTRRAGKVVVMGNCEGFDAPVLDAVVLCGAFTTVGPYLQAIGRGLRPYTDPATGRRKTDCQIYDLRGAVHLHGLPDDARRWSLEGAQGRSAVSATTPLRRCAHCHALYRPRPTCPACGCEHSVDARPLRIQRAEMLNASGVPVELRARKYLGDKVLAILNAKPHLSADLARRIAADASPAWVREALNLPAPAPRKTRHAA